MNNPRASHRIAFVGCGNISGPYAASLARHPELTLVGVFDVDASKRADFAQQHACSDYGTLDELGADGPDIVVNLTSAPFHYATTRELIERGMTVFSEKPLSMRYTEATELVALAQERGVRLACAPSLWLSDASLVAADGVLDGSLGTVRLINAEVNQGRIESWHPAPQSFYQVGPVFDAGVYPLTYLTAILGPIREVFAKSAVLLPRRTTMSGDSFEIATPDAWFIVATFASGATLRLTCTFYVDSATQPRFAEFHGDRGSLRLDDWIQPGSAIETADYAEGYRTVRDADTHSEIDWCIGLADLSAAIREGRPHRTQASHAAHVVEVLEAIARSADIGGPVGVSSDFPSPLQIPVSTSAT